LDNAQAALPSADSVSVLRTATQIEHVKLTKKTPWVVPDAAIAAWAEQCRQVLIAREQVQRVQWLHDATRAVTAALARARRERDLLTYDELILDLHVALHGAQGARLAHSIRAVLDAALVDEFQDTDAEQYAVFRRLFIDQPNGTLILVGDPKQAIYRFRGGDVFAYRAAANDAGERRWALMRNWRSDARLIEAVNTLFDPERVPRAFRHEFIDFVPAQYAGGDKQQARADRAWPTPLRFWLADGDAASNKRDRTALAVRACVDEMATLLQQGAAPGSIAVLTRSNQQADDMVRALRTRGIAAASRGKGPVTASDIAADVLTLLDALHRSEDAGRQRAALATRLMGYNAEALRALERDGAAWTRAMAELEELRVAHGRGGMVSLMWRLNAMAAPRLLCTPDGAQHLADLRQLAVALIETGAVAGGLAEAATWLTRMRAAEHNRDAERAAVDDDVAVQVLTMHKAKGLEWDIVFAPFLWDEVDGRDIHAPVRFHDAQGQLRVDLGSREASAHRQLHDDEADAETVRLIYVALTRARVASYVLVFERKKPSNAVFDGLLRGSASAPTLSAALTDLVARAPQAIAVMPLPSASDAMPASALLPEVHAQALAHRVDRGFALLSYSALVSEGAAEVRDHDTYVSRGDDSEDNPRGARLGECVHALLELAMRRTRAGVDAEDIDAYCLRFGFRGRAREVVRQLVQRALDAALDSADGRPDGSFMRLRDVEATARVAELEFHFAWRAGAWEALAAALGDTPPWLERLRRAPQGLFHGYIDLVFAHAGRWYVLDYKTNDLGAAEDAYAPAAMALAVQREGYDVQALVYSLAIHRMLRQRLGDTYDYDAHYGGAWYWFLRGMTHDSAYGRHGVRPGRALIDALDRAFAWSAP
jgi:exodeoxyribonuclease V beta subunit